MEAVRNSRSDAKLPDLTEQPLATINMIKQKFTYFPKLATEIRIAIWGFACYIPRELDVYAEELVANPEILSELDIYNEELVPIQNIKFSSSRGPPAILHTSREAREEALKHYKLGFEYGSSQETSSIIEPPKIYINPISDRVHFLPKMPFVFVPDELVHTLTCEYGLRRLAFSCGTMLEYIMFGEPSMLISSSGTLEELTLYHSKADFKKGESVTMLDPGKGPLERAAAEEMEKTKRELQRAWRSPYGMFKYAQDESLWPEITLKTFVSTTEL